MAISINGSTNVITGLAVGGLPDGCVDTDTLATSVTRGKILQAVTATTSTEHTNTSTTFADTGLTASITPSATSSKVLIMISQPYQLAASGADVGGTIRLLRDSTAIDTGLSTSGNPHKFYTYVQTGTSLQFITHYTLNFLDSPNTTSAVTYKTQDSHYYGSHSIKTQSSGFSSYITLLEVGA